MGKTTRSKENLEWDFESGHIPVLFGDGKLKFNPATQKRQVLLIGDGFLYDEGIWNLLNYQPSLNTRHANYNNDASILKDVVLFQPDVVVLIASSLMNLDYIVGMLMSAQAAHLRLVLLSLDTVQGEIYEGGGGEVKSKHFTMLKVDDFLLAVDKNWNDIP